MRNMNCLRCGTKMEYAKRTKLQLGEAAVVMGQGFVGALTA